MKKYILCLCSLALSYFGYTTAAECPQEGFYIKGMAGANWIDFSKTDVNPIYTGAIGYQFNQYISADVEYGYRESRWKDWDLNLKTQTALVHLYSRLPFDIFCLKPYVGVGLGYAKTSTKIDDCDCCGENIKGFAWEAVAGVSYALCDNIELDLEFRNLHTRTRLDENSVLAGLKFTF